MFPNRKHRAEPGRARRWRQGCTLGAGRPSQLCPRQLPTVWTAWSLSVCGAGQALGVTVKELGSGIRQSWLHCRLSLLLSVTFP